MIAKKPFICRQLHPWKRRLHLTYYLLLDLLTFRHAHCKWHVVHGQWQSSYPHTNRVHTQPDDESLLLVYKIQFKLSQFVTGRLTYVTSRWTKGDKAFKTGKVVVLNHFHNWLQSFISGRQMFHQQVTSGCKTAESWFSGVSVINVWKQTASILVKLTSTFRVSVLFITNNTCQWWLQVHKTDGGFLSELCCVRNAVERLLNTGIFKYLPTTMRFLCIPKLADNTVGVKS